jgi:hypothetical protein
MRSQILSILLTFVTIVAFVYVIYLACKRRLDLLPQIVVLGGIAIGSTLTLLGIRETWVFLVFVLGSNAAAIMLIFFLHRT